MSNPWVDIERTPFPRHPGNVTLLNPHLATKGWERGETGIYTLSGKDVGLNRNRPIIAEAGAYVLSGKDAILEQALAFSLFATTTDVAGNSLSLPGSLAANDLGVICEWGFTSTPNTPSGWSSAYQLELEPDLWLSVSYKKLVGTETTVTCSTDTGYGMARTVYIFRPNKNYSTITPGSWTSNYGGSGAPTNRTVTVSGAEPIIVFGLKGGTDDALQLTGSPALGNVLAANTGFHDLRTGIIIYNAPGSAVNNTVSGSDDGEGNMLAAGFLRIAP